jgi:rod shape determining protein RodA
MHWPMNIAIALLLLIGVLFVYSSCFVGNEDPVRPLYERQLVWVAVGVLCYLGLAALDYRVLGQFAPWFYGVSLVLLLMVLFFGTRIYGARRWLMVFRVGLQPSEFAKLAVLVLLARLLSRYQQPAGWLSSVFIPLALVAVPVLLVLKEPDLGTAAVFVPPALVMMFIAGVPWRSLLILVAGGLVFVGVVLGAVFLPEAMGMDEEQQDRFNNLTGLSRNQRERILVFFDSDRDPLGFGWNRRQSEIAVGSGGPWGKGFRKGTSNILGFLPPSVAPTDFIYSVIAEEKGFFGSVVVLGLFATVIVFGIHVAARTEDRMGRLLCVGVTVLIFCHVFINIAMTIGLMPITGLPLPLLSYGGSFMVAMMSALGMIQSVYIRSQTIREF